MKTNAKRNLIYFLIEILYTVVMIAFLFWLRNNYSVLNSFEVPLFNSAILILVIMIWFIGPMLNRYAVLIYSGLCSLYLVSQNIYLRAFHQYYRFNTAIDLINEVQGVKSSVLEFITFNDYLPFITLIVITIIFVVLYFLFQRRCFKLIYRIPYKLASLLLIFLIASQMNTFNNMIEETRHQEDAFQLNKTDFYIYDQIPNVNQFVDKFGLITYGYRDAQTLFEHEYYTEQDYQTVHDFLAAREPLKENVMTGIFEGKSLLIVQAESFNDMVLDPELTPTLYKMKHGGISVKGFNTPSLPGSTSDTEFMANTSFWPNSAGHAICYKYPNNTYITTLPKMFKQLGYNVNAFHNCYGQYYNRTITFPNWGYDKFYDCTELGLEDAVSDKEVMEILKWIMVETNEPFMNYWISYSGHQPYNLEAVGVQEKNVARVKEKYPNLDDSYVAFIAKNMEIDQCLGDLFRELDKVGKLDDLVVFFYGDHLVKGLDMENGASYYKETGIQFDESKKYTDLFIYNIEIEPMEYEKVSTVLDLVPTIANMWNIDVDTSTFLGRDIFDEDYRGIHFSEWDYWYTDDYYYDLIGDKFYPKTDDFDENKAREEIEYYLTMKDISSKAMHIDYFREEDN